MEERVGPLTFTSNFDSGNLARAERVKSEENSGVEEVDDFSAGNVVTPDYEYNVWTNPDCAGTEFENLNRTWFHFGVKGGTPGKLLKINIMNLNRQGKLYAQGMSVIVKVVPGKNKWERIREKPTYETVDGQFHLSFSYRFPDQRNVTHYFAFCYPYSYDECQTRLQELDLIYLSCKNLTPLSPKDSIYYHRELLCYSNDGLRVDLLTVTSCKGILAEREERLEKLFPDSATPRAHKFHGKKVFFLSARVHPGETPASFVFNGFLNFILRSEDPRAAALRDQYVFKLIPILNPDGVKRGHYRTDARGVNLNRLYLDPDPFCHPSVYAAKSVIMYHHGKVDELSSICSTCGKKKASENENENTAVTHTLVSQLSHDFDPDSDPRPQPEGEEDNQNCQSPPRVRTGSPDYEQVKTMFPDKERTNGDGGKTAMHVVMEEKSKKSKTNEDEQTTGEKKGPESGRKNSITKAQQVCLKKEPIKTSLKNTRYEQSAEELEICSCASSSSKESGIAYYVDLHGHASKRGCFVYANYLENEDDYVQSIMLAKLVSINSANFDFTACSFTEKNMYTKDKRDHGLSKEGSGRVAVFKATGIIHSYTLECNYNCGRMANPVPPATCDGGRATPPPPPGFPPKFTPEIYEEVGRAIAISALDMNNTNPWSRLPLSEFNSVDGVRNWVRRFVRSAKNAPSVPKRLSRIVTKTSSVVANAGTNTRQKITSTFASPSTSDTDSHSQAPHKQTDKANAGHLLHSISKEPVKKVPEDPKHQRRFTFPLSNKLAAVNTKPVCKTQGSISSSTGCLHQSSSQTTNTVTTSVAGTLKFQIYKTREQQRVSLDLPKTNIEGPHLRMGKGIPPAKGIFAASDSKTGSKSLESQNNKSHFTGLQNRRTSLGKLKSSNSASSQSDEEKKKRNGRPRGKKSTRRKGNKTESGNEVLNRGTADKSINGSVDRTEERVKSGSLLRRNSSRSRVPCAVNTVVSCEVVDITELPHLPATGSDTSVAYWIDA